MFVGNRFLYTIEINAPADQGEAEIAAGLILRSAGSLA